MGRMAEIRIHEGESIESALRRFKRKVQQEDIIKDVKKHPFYLKPGERSESNRHWLATAAVRESDLNRAKIE